MGRSLPSSAGWSGYPSIAALSINPGIDAMGQPRPHWGGLSGTFPRAPPRARRNADLFLEGAIERGLGFVSHLGAGLRDADAGLFEQPPRQLQAPAREILHR